MFFSSFQVGVVIPIPKSGKRDVQSCDSHRPITNCSILGKFFELCIKKGPFEHLDVGLNQEGFKKEWALTIPMQILMQQLMSQSLLTPCFIHF